jgi:hypothetical protein
LAALRGDTLAGADPAPQPEPSARLRRMPRESLDARNDLPEESPSQVAFGKLQSEIPGMLDQPATRLETAVSEGSSATSSGWRRVRPGVVGGLPRL